MADSKSLPSISFSIYTARLSSAQGKRNLYLLPCLKEVRSVIRWGCLMPLNVINCSFSL